MPASMALASLSPPPGLAGLPPPILLIFFFFNDTATTEIYTLSLHDALPISSTVSSDWVLASVDDDSVSVMSVNSGLSIWGYTHPASDERYPSSEAGCVYPHIDKRSEEHTSELQSHSDLVCRLLLEKKNHRQRSGATSRVARTSVTAAWAARPTPSSRCL